MKQKNPDTEHRRPSVIYGVLILLGLFLVSSCVATIIAIGRVGERATFDFRNGNVAVVPIKGAITTESQSGFFSTDGTSSQDVIDTLDAIKKNKRIKAVIFEIDSPGGSPVASEEIGNAIKDLGLPTAAWIREVGASGAYWVASSTDHIIASRLSITGSIGVIGSYLEYADLLTRFNITYRRLVGGEYKDTGTPYRRLRQDEQAMLQQKIDLIYNAFVEEVAKNRNLSVNRTEELATGMFFLGSEARDVGLIDEIGGKKEAVAYIERRIGENATLVDYGQPPTFLETISQLMQKNSYQVGRGMSSFLEKNSLSIRT